MQNAPRGREHSAILLTFIKLPFVIKIFVLFILSGRLRPLLDLFTRKPRVATVREKVLENEKISRSGKSRGITFSVREIFKKNEKSHGKVREFLNFPKEMLVNRLLEILVSIICKQY